MDRRPSTSRPVALSSPSITATTTITIGNSDLSSFSSQHEQQQQPEVLFLPLNRKKKKVSWKEGTVDNEFMQKKSSKKCCIFHKQKPFDEDDSDDETYTITLIKVPMITVTVGFAVRIIMKLAQAVRVLIDRKCFWNSLNLS